MPFMGMGFDGVNGGIFNSYPQQDEGYTFPQEEEVLKPTSSKCLRKIPKFQYSSRIKNDLLENKFAKDLKKCSICYDDYDYDDDICYLACGHTYHWLCAKQWLEKKNSCCLCRFELPTQDREEDKKRVEKNEKAIGIHGVEVMNMNESLVSILCSLDRKPYLSRSEYTRIEGELVSLLLKVDGWIGESLKNIRKEMVKKIQFVLKRIDEIMEFSDH